MRQAKGKMLLTSAGLQVAAAGNYRFYILTHVALFFTFF